MQKLISIDLKADFGFFRKPDVNAGVNLSYNMLHKPALLGILGAIVGLEGYREYGKMPEYYEKLGDLKIGIEPLEDYHEKGNFIKTTIKYSNTIGYANKGTNYLTEEATLIKPAYRCYILVDTDIPLQEKLYHYLKNGKAEYLPYFGKNEHAAWWEPESFADHDFSEGIAQETSINTKSIFQKSVQAFKNQKEEPVFDLLNLSSQIDPFMYFERLPTGFDAVLKQYDLRDIVYSTFKIKATAATDIKNLYFLKSQNCYVQLL